MQGSQDKVIEETENKSLCTFFTKYLDETEHEPFFIKMNIKKKFIFSVMVN